MARLTIMDDGISDGEVIRIRKDCTIIGRDRGDVQIPHDLGIASEHLRIERINNGDSFHWKLVDLSSETGFWVRVRRIELRDDDWLMAGKNRFIFRAGRSGSQNEDSLFARLGEGSIPGHSTFDPLGEVRTGYSSIALVQTTPDPFQSAPFVHLIENENWIGRESSCAMCVPVDPYLGGKHVRLFREADRWFAETQGITNGMWIRRASMNVNQSCAFQLGEQRFHFVCQWKDEEE